MLISQGENSDLRYNFYYPRWAYDIYVREMQAQARENGWMYLDLFPLVPEQHFTNSAIHLDPEGEQLFAEEMMAYLLPILAGE